jgi:uncharacterized damage-inducible protein DinB
MENQGGRIVDELQRAIEGDPWHGDSASAILRGVTTAVAGARPPGGAHSIWEIVRHMTAWTHEVARRLDGHPPGEPQEGDWPPPSGSTDEDWQRDVASLTDANRRLMDKVRAIDERALHAPPVERRDRESGSGMTHYMTLHGLAQHHAYHAGQIAVLKRVVAAAGGEPNL